MIHSVVLGIPAIMALLLGNIDMAHPQDRGAQKLGEPKIVVFHAQASLESFRGMY